MSLSHTEYTSLVTARHGRGQPLPFATPTTRLDLPDGPETRLARAVVRAAAACFWDGRTEGAPAGTVAHYRQRVEAGAFLLERTDRCARWWRTCAGVGERVTPAARALLAELRTREAEATAARQLTRAAARARIAQETQP